MWAVYGLLPALFSALTSILEKMGMGSIDSNLAAAIRTVVAPIDKFSVVISMVLAFVVLGEKVKAATVIGGILIAAGTLVLLL